MKVHDSCELNEHMLNVWHVLEQSVINDANVFMRTKKHFQHSI